MIMKRFKNCLGNRYKIDENSSHLGLSLVAEGVRTGHFPDRVPAFSVCDQKKINDEKDIQKAWGSDKFLVNS